METELIRLLKLAQGSRTLNSYARQADVSAGNLSRIMNGQTPTPGILQKLAAKAYNNVTYTDLMHAAGYIEDKTQTDKDSSQLYTSPLTEKDESDIEKRLEKLRKDLASQSGLMLSGEAVSEEALQAIFESLTSGIKYAKMINKKYTPKKYRKSIEDSNE